VKILLVAMANSLHTARWVEQIADQGWDIHIFPSVVTFKVHPKLKNVTVYFPNFKKRRLNNSDERRLKPQNLNKDLNGLPKQKTLPIFHLFSRSFKGMLVEISRSLSIFYLNKVIKKVKPDIIHSLEFQHAGYLTLEVKKQFKGKFPTWIATNWGSDIYLFGRLVDHQEKIKAVLSGCKYYSCECLRDVALAREFGFKGQVLPVFPNAGGFDFSIISELRKPGPVSARQKIMLKGYQGWAGRALVGLRALERCADLLQGYEIIIHSEMSDAVKIATELFENSTGIKVTFIVPGQPHNEILSLHGQARISIGLSISDGISTSFLEALVMGAFPIQSFTACADEWIHDGQTGIIVHPDDPDKLELAIRRALLDNELVDKAAEMNYKMAVNRLDHGIIKAKVIDLYNRVARTENIFNSAEDF
jgi:hypothetical protein